MLDLHHPLVESVLVPGALSIGLIGLGRRFDRKHRLDALAIGIAFIISAVIIIDRPLWPSRSALEKLPLALAGYLLLGLGLTVRAAPTRIVMSLATVGMILTILWLAWAQLYRSDTFWEVGGLGILGIVLLLRVSTAQCAGVNSAIKLGVAAFGLSGVAIISGSMLIGEIAGSLASVVLGSLLLRRHSDSTTSLVFSGTLPFVSVTSLCVLLTDAPPLAIATLVVVFFVDGFKSPVSGTTRHSTKPLTVALRACALTGAAIGIALLTDSPSDLYYG